MITYLNIEDSFHFSFFNRLIEHGKYPNSNHIFSSVGVKDGLRFNYVLQSMSMPEIMNKFKGLWLKVVSRSSNHTLGCF